MIKIALAFVAAATLVYSATASAQGRRQDKPGWEDLTPPPPKQSNLCQAAPAMCGGGKGGGGNTNTGGGGTVTMFVCIPGAGCGFMNVPYFY